MTDPGGPIHIFNLALSHLMIGVEVQTWSDPSKEAATLRRYYPTARRKVLRDFPWPFATKIVPLALVSGSPTAPASTEYTYAYRTPQDNLRLVRILSGLRQDSVRTRVVYRELSDDEGPLIYTDFPPQLAQTIPAVLPQLPQLEYIWDNNNHATFKPDFELALSFYLAFLAAPRLTKADPTKLGDRAFTLYTKQIEEARDNTMNEQQPDPPQESSFVQVRE